MAHNNRKPNMLPYTLKDFQKQFPNDATCLEWLKNRLYPEGIYCETCEAVTKHHRVKSRPSYSCDHCGHHVHPTADTIFHKSPTPLSTWFYAVYLMASTRCGISAKQIQRETGVTYKTAWRMFKQIRSMLTDDKRNPDAADSVARLRWTKRTMGADPKAHADAEPRKLRSSAWSNARAKSEPLSLPM